MKKEEAPVKKPEVKEEGASKPMRVVYSDKRKRKIFKFSFLNGKAKLCGYVALVIVCIICVCAFSYAFGNPRKPRFTLDDLYLDPATNSTVVKLSSFNPSSKSSIDYHKIRVYVWIRGYFKTEYVYLESILQSPQKTTGWAAAVATNNDNGKRPGGSFQIRNGVTNGLVISESSITWKAAGILSLINRSLRVTCPVSINLKDLTSVVPKPMTRCSTSFI